MLLELMATLCFDPVCFDTNTQSIAAPRPIPAPFLKAGQLPFLIKLDGRWYPTVNRTPFITFGPLGVRAYAGSMTNCRRADGSAPPFQPPGFYYGPTLRALYGVTGRTKFIEADEGYVYLEVTTRHGDTVCDGETVPPIGGADLIFNATVPSTVPVTGPVTWTISGVNAGPDPATGVVVNAIISNVHSLVSASGSGWSCSSGGTASLVVSCERASAPLGALPSLTIVARHNNTGQVGFSCTARADQPDPQPLNTGAACSGVTSVGVPNPDDLFRDSFEAQTRVFSTGMEEQ